MYESLAEFKNIVVSGPQRSGTRFAAKAIAHDTGKQYIDEKDINFHDFRLLEWHLCQGNMVIQCPALSHMLHYITDPSTLIILIVRRVEDIVASQRRVGWDKYARWEELHKYGCSEGIVSRIKYDFWTKYQKPILKDRARTIDYDTLKDHPLFIAKENRASFKWDQTE